VEGLASEGEPRDNDVGENDSESDRSVVKSLRVDRCNSWQAEDDGNEGDVDDADICDWTMEGVNIVKRRSVKPIAMGRRESITYRLNLPR
jgi:hypothetical protein